MPLISMASMVISGPSGRSGGARNGQQRHAAHRVVRVLVSFAQLGEFRQRSAHHESARRIARAHEPEPDEIGIEMNDVLRVPDLAAEMAGAKNVSGRRGFGWRRIERRP